VLHMVCCSQCRTHGEAWLDTYITWHAGIDLKCGGRQQHCTTYKPSLRLQQSPAVCPCRDGFEFVLGVVGMAELGMEATYGMPALE
jgi:hypothetical protein